MKDSTGRDTSPVSEENKALFLKGMAEVSNGAYKMLSVAYGPDGDKIFNKNPDFLDFYSHVFPMSFDEWWHTFVTFNEMVAKMLDWDVQPGDCMNCISTVNPHHNVEMHMNPLYTDRPGTGCTHPSCSCLGFVSLQDSIR